MRKCRLLGLSGGIDLSSSTLLPTIYCVKGLEIKFKINENFRRKNCNYTYVKLYAYERRLIDLNNCRGN